jgi:hypothetical protein
MACDECKKRETIGTCICGREVCAVCISSRKHMCKAAMDAFIAMKKAARAPKG